MKETIKRISADWSRDLREDAAIDYDAFYVTYGDRLCIGCRNVAEMSDGKIHCLAYQKDEGICLVCEEGCHTIFIGDLEIDKDNQDSLKRLE